MAPTILAAAPATPAGAVAAQPTTEPPGEEPPAEIEVPDPVPGEEQCQITDFRLTQLSGLVAVDEGYFVTNDGSAQEGIFLLDHGCQVIEQIGYPSPTRDPEDLELDWSSNTLWVGDTGDNAAVSTASGEPRPTVALWRVDLAGDRTPVIHRFVYEDGQPRDAEALVLDGDGMPIIITKSVGEAELFRPTELAPDNPPEQAVTLEKVGEWLPPDTGSEHDILPSATARRAVTGGATSPDGSVVVVRTYTDAFEFEVPDGDVVAAITTGVPRVTPLPGEPQGEAISYTPDGERFVTVSEIPDEQADFTPVILSYTPTPPPPPEPTATAAPAPTTAGGGWSLINSVQDIINLIAAVGVIGLLLVAAGIFGIVRGRRRWAAQQQADPDDPDGDEPPGTGRAAGVARPATGRARPPGDQPGWEPGTGGVYGSSAARAEPGYHGTEYGGGEHSGSDYRAGQYGEGYAGDGYADGYAGEGYAAGYGGEPDAGYHAGYHGTEYGGGTYGSAGGYGGGGHPEPYDQDWHAAQQPAGDYGDPRYRPPEYEYPEPDPGGAYQGGTYQSGAPDYYSDDPDYPYEFRERDR